MTEENKTETVEKKSIEIKVTFNEGEIRVGSNIDILTTLHLLHNATGIVLDKSIKKEVQEEQE